VETKARRSKLEDVLRFSLSANEAHAVAAVAHRGVEVLVTDEGPTAIAPMGGLLSLANLAQAADAHGIG
jgi:hypothetical protein